MKNASHKEQYNVYLITTFYGECGEVSENQQFIGKTWALSKAQAENNVRFRSEGAKPAFASYDTGRDTCIDYSYRAVLASGDK